MYILLEFTIIYIISYDYIMFIQLYGVVLQQQVATNYNIFYAIHTTARSSNNTCNTMYIYVLVIVVAKQRLRVVPAVMSWLCIKLQIASFIVETLYLPRLCHTTIHFYKQYKILYYLYATTTTTTKAKHYYYNYIHLIVCRYVCSTFQKIYVKAAFDATTYMLFTLLYLWLLLIRKHMDCGFLINTLLIMFPCTILCSVFINVCVCVSILYRIQ